MPQIANIYETSGLSSGGSFESTTPTTNPRSAPVGSLAPFAHNAAITGEAANTPTKFEPLISRIRGGDRLDPLLLDRAAEILEDIEHSDPEAMSLNIESLRYVACQLWLTAASASMFHRSILAIVESVALSTERITPGQAAALRGAIQDLAQPRLSEQFVDVVRSRFIDEGYNPLAPLSQVKEDTDGGNH